ncbi:uncharacterized protein [Rutidosis leptorrhynchoides]|uniref:uncharacterized protein n=1 Tax=Rutidosis leptorrhynchoides TaxID=125765 RepID=UPI003A99949B
MEVEYYDPETGFVSKNTDDDSSGKIFSTELIDISIQDARNKKENIDSNMDLIKSLMREVESKERAAEKAKEAADKYRLYVLAKVGELKKAQQIAKEANDLKSSEVYTQKAALATEMRELQLCVSGVIKKGDEQITDLAEMRRSLEHRLTSAAMKKKAADKEKSESVKSFSYQNQQMEKLKEDSKRLKQEAIENLKLQQFLNDRKRAVNMLKEELSCKCFDVKLLKGEIKGYLGIKGDFQEALVSEEYCSFGPIIQEIRPAEEYQRTDGMIRGWLRDRTSRYYGKESRNKAMNEWIKGEIKDAITEYEQGEFDINGYGCYSEEVMDAELDWEEMYFDMIAVAH